MRRGGRRRCRWALVAAPLELEAVDQVLVGRGPDQVHRLGVRDVGEQRAERQHEARVVPLGDGDDLLGEQPPPQRRLRAEDDDRIATRASTRSTGRPSATRSCG
jgi:hypothetical protein